jgi:hypothetical protein
MYSDDPELWKSDFCPVGSLRNWVTAGKMAPLPTWLTAQERDEQSKIVLEKDYTGPLNWYEDALFLRFQCHNLIMRSKVNLKLAGTKQLSEG